MAFPIVFRPGRSFMQDSGDPLWSSVDRLVEDLWRNNAAQAAAGFAPRLEVVERENEYLVTAELPGLEEKDFQIEVHGNVLTLRGEKRSEQSGEEKGRHFTRARLRRVPPRDRAARRGVEREGVGVLQERRAHRHAPEGRDGQGAAHPGERRVVDASADAPSPRRPRGGTASRHPASPRLSSLRFSCP